MSVWSKSHGFPGIYISKTPFLLNMTIHSQRPKGRLLAIGGHERRETSEQGGAPDTEQSADFILQRFVDELPQKGTIVVIPTASEEPEAAAEDYVKLFSELGVKQVEVLNITGNRPIATKRWRSSIGPTASCSRAATSCA
jgi:cyanophycinase-like exopeptidase